MRPRKRAVNGSEPQSSATLEETPQAPSTPPGVSPASDSPPAGRRSRQPLNTVLSTTMQRRRRSTPMTSRDVEAIAASAGAGLSISQIGRALLLKDESVRKVLEDPEVRQNVLEARSKYRATVMANTLSMAQRVWDRVHDAVKRDDAKAAKDYVTSLKDMEHMSASASGELRPQVAIQHNQVTLQTDFQEALALLKKLEPVNASD